MIQHGVPRVLISVSRRRSFTSKSFLGPVTAALESRIQSGDIHRDDTQLSLASKLDSLHHSLASSDSKIIGCIDQFKPEDYYYNQVPSRHSLFEYTADKIFSFARQTRRSINKNLNPPTPRSIYIYGSVGIGKTFCMDLFYDLSEKVTLNRKRRRAHFHEFMLDVHQRIHQKRHQRKRDVVPEVAVDLAREAQLLCFDEFQVTDIADAMIIKRLFEILFDMGVIVVTTSNRPPDALYEGGLNRSLFLPFIDTIHEKCDVISMDTVHDYRRDAKGKGGTDVSYFWPCDDSKTKESLLHIFGDGGGGEETIPVMMGRSLKVSRANDACGWFDFKELCHQPLGAADYISLSNRFRTIIIENIPQLNANYYNEARRFVTLVDALYEARTRLVISAHVPMDRLLVAFDAAVESNDGDEEMAIESFTTKEKAIQNQRGNEQSLVVGKGGSSSSFSTTMIRTEEGDVEWSATGRVGVSLAQLSGVKEVAFSFRRAESRLAEMSAHQWSNT